MVRVVLISTLQCSLFVSLSLSLSLSLVCVCVCVFHATSLRFVLCIRLCFLQLFSKLNVSWYLIALSMMLLV